MSEPLARRATGLVLVALAALLPVVAYTRLEAWDAELAGRATAASGVVEVLVGGVALWLIIGAGLWWHRRRMTMWPVWARWTAFPGLFLVLFECLVIAGERGRPMALVIGVGVAVACWVISEAVRLVTTRPVTNALVHSNLEIPFPTRGLQARLCIREDRLVLDSLASRRKRSRDAVAVPWDALRSIELIQVDQETVCQVLVFSGESLANAREFDVFPGPALHIVGTARELLVPVTDEVGRVVVAAVEARSACIEVSYTQLTQDRWLSKVSARKTGALTRVQHHGRVHHRTGYRPYHLIPAVAFLLTPITMLSLMAASLVSGDEKVKRQFGLADALDQDDKIGIAVLGVGSLVFLYLLRFPVRQFRRFMDGQDYIEAYPEPPTRPNTGTVPGSGKRKNKR